MKKSTLIATIAVLGAVATLAATNLKLKSEYNKGNIKDPYTKTRLAAFKYIKVAFDSTSANGEEFRIKVSKKSESSIATYYSERAKLLYNVSNDTLYISNDPFDKDHNSLHAPVIINTPELKAISVTKGSYHIHADDMDSLSVTANKKTGINLNLRKIKWLNVNATDNVSIIVASKDTIGSALIQLADKSSFSAKDIIIRQKKLQLGDSATLNLTGRSMKDFGIQ
jgi:hypothetical protein